MRQTIEGFSLSPQQMRLWLLQQGSDNYRAYCTLLIEGALDTAALRRAVETVFLRHGIFRTTFYRLPETALPVQVINDRLLYSWQQATVEADLEQREKLDRLLLEAQSFSLNIEQGPLLNCSLLTLAEQKHVLCVSASPLHVDVHTLSHLIREVSSLYHNCSGTLGDQESEVPQYVQFSEWQNSLLEEEEGRAYWSNKSIAPSMLLALPYERKREISTHFNPFFVSTSIKPALQRNIDALLKCYQCSLPVFLFTCWQLLLWSFLNLDELLCGLGVNGRVYDELNNIAGPTAKYIPFFCHPNKRQRFCDFLEAVKVEYEEGLAHQLYFASAGPETVTAPLLYPFGFDYYKIAPPAATDGGISFALQQCYSRSEPFKIRLVVQEHPDESLTVTLEYHADLYAAQDIQRLSKQLMLLINDAVRRPECVISELEIFSDYESEQNSLTSDGGINWNPLSQLDITTQSDSEASEDINAVVPRDMLEFQLLQIWEEKLQVRPILITDNFFELGGHSILAVSLMAQISKQLGIDLPLATLFDHRTIAELAVIVRQQTYTPDAPILVAIQPEGTKLPFFCIHPAGGTVFCYTHLARHLGPDQPFYGLQIPEFLEEDEIYLRVEEMAARYIAEMQTVQPQGPYSLGGWSSGGVMAFEIAQQLRRRNQEVGLLALLDTVIPHGHLHPEAQTEKLDTSDVAIVQEVTARKGSPVKEGLFTLSPEEQLSYVLEEGKKANFVPADTGLEQFRRLRRIHLMNLHSMTTYIPEIYPGQIDMFRAIEPMRSGKSGEGPAVHPVGWSLTGGWEALTTKGVVVHKIPGNHKQMMNEPNVQAVATALANCLEQVASSV